MSRSRRLKSTLALLALTPVLWALTACGPGDDGEDLPTSAESSDAESTDAGGTEGDDGTGSGDLPAPEPVELCRFLPVSDVEDLLRTNLGAEFPSLRIAYDYSDECFLEVPGTSGDWRVIMHLEKGRTSIDELCVDRDLPWSEPVGDTGCLTVTEAIDDRRIYFDYDGSIYSISVRPRNPAEFAGDDPVMHQTLADLATLFARTYSGE